MISGNEKETNRLAQRVIDDLMLGDNIILLKGDLGAGKTTFSQGVLEYLGAEGPFTSPTFVIMKDYQVGLKIKKERDLKGFIIWIVIELMQQDFLIWVGRISLKIRKI